MSFSSTLAQREQNRSTEYAIVLDSSQPIGDEFAKQVSNPAKEFEFKLDSFQMQAIMHLEKHENVFVSAHTSAGKTVVAEYAIAMAFRSKSRVVYTSPIKALSNQKYRDFNHEFSDVGLITGDVQIKAEASCLIMTTEILLQMLYNSNELINELEWVVFDEVHYVNDPERGHVWEEVFILLPEKVNLVLLSATVPNVVQFADWLGRARKRKTYVISTYKRPVPLEHFLYLGRDGKSQNQRLLIVDSNGNFKNDGYREAVEIMEERKRKLGYIKKTPQTERNIFINLIRHLKNDHKLPVICFTLSRNRCDSNLEMLMAINKDNFQLTTKEEESKIHRYIRNNLKKLKDCDQKIPQIQKVSEMLERGFGVHHSGILPILKEITEILFCDGLVKVLFATETFAMGVNMPARTVVFDSVEKHDGNQFRDLKASEYIQMAGRAGRRGKDDTGTVIILCKYDIPDSPRLLKIMQGSASELVSQFRLTYHMILNLHKKNNSEQNIESFLEKSFGEHNRLKQTLEISEKLKSCQLKAEEFPSLECNVCSLDIESFCYDFDEYQSIGQLVMPYICGKAMEKKLLHVGRIVAIAGKKNPFEAAVVLNISKGKNIGEYNLITLSLAENDNEFEMKTIESKDIHRILSKQIKKLNSNEIIKENDNKNSNKPKEETMAVVEKLKELSLENNYRIFESPFVDPKENLKLREIDFSKKLDTFNNLCQQLLSYNCIKCDNFAKHYESMKQKVEIVKESQNFEFNLSSNSLQFLPEYNARIEVLKEKDYFNKHLVLQLKGRVACLISEHELVITEMLMNNALRDLTKEEIAALLSCFVFQQNISFNNTVTEALDKKREELQSIALEIANLQKKFGITEESFNEELKFGLMQVIYEWAKGEPFVKVMQLTEVQEGIVVRCIQRLEELLKFVKLAAKLVGNHEMETKIDSTSESIRRDIVFFASLYTIPDPVINDTENDNQFDETLSSNFL